MIKKFCQILALLFFVFINAQSKDAPSINQIKNVLKNKGYSASIIKSLRNTMVYDNSEYVIVEGITNDIIFYSVKPLHDNTFSTIPYLFKIVDKKVEQINLTPTDKGGKVEPAFYDKVKMQTKADWIFLGYVDYFFQKDKKGIYTIITTIKNSGSDNSISEIHYSTKDFLTFTLIKMSRDGLKWINFK